MSTSHFILTKYKSSHLTYASIRHNVVFPDPMHPENERNSHNLRWGSPHLYVLSNSQRLFSYFSQRDCMRKVFCVTMERRGQMHSLYIKMILLRYDENDLSRWVRKSNWHFVLLSSPPPQVETTTIILASLIQSFGSTCTSQVNSPYLNSRNGNNYDAFTYHMD